MLHKFTKHVETQPIHSHTHDFAGPVSQNMHQALTGHLCT